MGLAPLVIADMFERIVEVSKTGVPILLVEQNAKMALSVSDYAYVLEQGKVTIEGAAAALKSDSRIAAAYLGVKA